MLPFDLDPQEDMMAAIVAQMFTEDPVDDFADLVHIQNDFMQEESRKARTATFDIRASGIVYDLL
jgi:hypothetical protein